MSRKSRQRQKGNLGFVSVRVMADYDSSGLWLMKPVGVFRHGGISYEALKVSPALAAQFAAWIEAYWDFYFEEKNFDIDVFNQRGRELSLALKAHLGQESYVEFVPEGTKGIGKAEVIK